MGEFGLIDRYFAQRFEPLLLRLKAERPDVAPLLLGIGDDCALLPSLPHAQLALSTDTLVEGRHFLSTVSPNALGHKALAVNLSDLAACGAKPLAFLLSLTLPRVDQAWLDGFSSGLLALATEHGCALIGGNTSAGPLSIGITVLGEVPVVNGKSSALLRSGARVGDHIWVSGYPGQARAALELFRGTWSCNAELFEQLRNRMERPTPRVALGLALRGIASAAIDVSDGLLGDLAHVLSRSGALGAEIFEAAFSPVLIATNIAGTWTDGLNDPKNAISKHFGWVLNGGDDYELLVTAAPGADAAVLAAGQQSNTPVWKIGRMTNLPGIQLLRNDGSGVAWNAPSFDHFA